MTVTERERGLDARAALELRPAGRRARGRAARAAAHAGEDRLSGADAQGVQRALLAASSRRRARCGCTSRRSTIRSPSSGARSTRRASMNRSGIWQIRKSVMRNVLPAFGSTVGSVLAAPGLARCRGVGHAARAARDPGPRGARRGAVCARVDPRLAAGSVEGALHLYACGRFRRPTFRSCWPNTSPSASPTTSSTATAATSSTARAACTRTRAPCSA